ncbi:MAG: flagellin-like protein [Candidatus Nanohaloarchaea archaeon]|jgi:flagellin-like protein
MSLPHHLILTGCRRIKNRDGGISLHLRKNFANTFNFKIQSGFMTPPLSKHSKGISPLIAGVMLIAFVISLATISGPFFTNIISQQTDEVSESYGNVESIANSRVSIESLDYNDSSGNYTVTVVNSGNAPVENLTFTLIGDTPVQKRVNTELDEGEIEVVELKSENRSSETSLRVDSSGSASDETDLDSISDSGGQEESNSVARPVAETLSATSISTSSATLEGNVTQTGGETPQVYFNWSQTGSGLDNQVSSGSTAGTFSEEITGLSSGTSYEFIAVAGNSAGQVNGSVETFTTDTNEVTGAALEDWSGSSLNSGPDFSTQSFEESLPASSPYTTLSRPSWSQSDGGSVSFDGGVARFNPERTALMDLSSKSVSTPVTVEFRWKSNSAQSAATNFIVLAESGTTAGSDISGYSITPKSGAGNDIEYYRWDDGSEVDLAEYDNAWSRDSDFHTFKIEIDSSGTHTIYFDGSQLGTVTDSTYTNLNKAGLSGYQRNGDADIEIDWWKIY